LLADGEGDGLAGVGAGDLGQGAVHVCGVLDVVYVVEVGGFFEGEGETGPDDGVGVNGGDEEG
jgi:hypothetical protein